MTGRPPKALVLSWRHKLCDRNSFFAIANARLTAAGSASYGSFPFYSTDEYENAKNPSDEPPGDRNEWRIPVLDCHSQDCVQREPQRWGSDQTRAWVVRGGMPGHRGRLWGVRLALSQPTPSVSPPTAGADRRQGRHSPGSSSRCWSCGLCCATALLWQAGKRGGAGPASATHA
jgi:hypothetical protein